MNRISIIASAVCLTALASCGTSKYASVAEMDGEWSFTAVNGNRIEKTDGQRPFIGFDSKAGRVYGYSGCNRIMSEMDKTSGELLSSHMGATMMACPDMETETKVLGALAKAKRCRMSKDGNLTLCDANGKAVATLKKRFYAMSVAELDGEWNIISVNNRTVGAGTDTKPTLSMDIKNNRISGNAGCNRIMGTLAYSNDKAQTVSFGQVATTRMACRDMETEKDIVAALNSVRHFGKQENGNITLYNEGSMQVMELSKGPKTEHNK